MVKKMVFTQKYNSCFHHLPNLKKKNEGIINCSPKNESILGGNSLLDKPVYPKAGRAIPQGRKAS
jgi:hypothetical protein